ncbi:MAG: flagellar hook-length control protein FliK [Terriglobia bacterium]
METLQVQSGNAIAPTLPGSTSVSVTPIGDESFAFTLGRALEGRPEPGQAGSSIAPKASPASPRGKGDASGASDSSSMASVFSNCFVTNMVQPAPIVALSSDAAESAASLSSPESTSDSMLNFASSLNTAAGRMSANTGTIFAPAAMVGVVAPGAFSPRAGQSVGAVGIVKTGASSSAARMQGQSAIQTGGLVSTPGKDSSEPTASAQPVITPTWFPGLQDNPLPSQPVEQQGGVEQSELKPVRASSPLTTQEPGAGQGTQTSPGLTDSWPQLGQLSPAELEVAPVSGPEANDSSTSIFAAGYPAPAESSVQPGNFAGADVQAAFNSTPSVGQTPLAAPLFGSEASGSSTPLYRTDHAAPAESSILGGNFAGAGLAAASNLTPSVAQTPQAASASGMEASDSSTPAFATESPELAEFSTLTGSFAGANLQAASNTTLPTGQVGQASGSLGPEASDSSTPVSATESSELAEFSSLLGNLAGADINVKASGNESQSAPDRFTTKSTPVAAGTLSSGLRMTAVDSVQVPPAPKSKIFVDIPAKAVLRSPQVSGSVTAEVSGQKVTEPEPASAQPPPMTSASSVAPLQPDVNPQPAPAATTLQNDTAPEATAIQSSGTAYTNSGETGAHANLSDASTSGQGKSGQQSGTALGGNPAIVIPNAPGNTTPPAADSTTNLLAPHASSVPISHANASAPQTSPPPSQPSATLSVWQNYDGGAGSIVRSASLSGSVNGAEMHVELRSGALGPLEVHAVMHEGSLGAEIHVQGQEAHTLLAAGLPSLERALGERNLRVENIAVYQDQAGGGMSGGGKQDTHSGSSPSPQHQVLPWDSPPQASKSASGSAEDEELANPATGLSVQA